MVQAMAIYALGHQKPSVHPDATVDPSAVIIGAVTIGPTSAVGSTVVIRGDDGHVVIGARTVIEDGTVIHTRPGTPTVVGDDCVIGPNAHLEGCTIEDQVLVGSGSIVLHSAVVRTGAVVEASALVPTGMQVSSWTIAFGVPAAVTALPGGRRVPELDGRQGARRPATVLRRLS